MPTNPPNRRSYSADDVMDYADPRAETEPRMAVTHGITGVAIPSDEHWPQAGQILSADKARQLGMQLVLAADEHDAFVDAVLTREQRWSELRGNSKGRATP